MNNNFENLKSEDVVSVYNGQILITNTTFTVNEFMSALKQTVESKIGNLSEEKRKWFEEGLDCKMLKPGAKSWQRGKVKLSLEFAPEVLEVETVDSSESENSKANSPLDDIRQMMSKDTQQNNS